MYYADISHYLDTSTGVANMPIKLNKSCSTGTFILVACLDLFIKPEKLGSDQKLYCLRTVKKG